MLGRIDIRSAVLAAGLALGAGSAAAQEYCVACTEPDAVYRCVIEGAQPGGGQPLQMLCVTAMAKAGGHGTCAVKRGTVFQCDGPVKRVPWVAAGEETPAPIATPRPPEQQPADPSAPPKTMQELTDRASKKTADDMKKAGETMKEGAQNLGDGITSGAKKTWDCLSSLFFKC